jgi:hypothetical protein
MKKLSKIFLTLLMSPILLLQSCDRELKPEYTAELKINRKIQKLPESHLLKIHKNGVSVCEYVEFLGVAIQKTVSKQSDSKVFSEVDVSSDKSQVTSKMKALANIEFNFFNKVNELHNSLSIKRPENLNIKEANEFFNMLNDLNPDWINADLYTSDTSSFENLSKFNEYQYRTIRIKKEANLYIVACEFVSKNLEY